MALLPALALAQPDATPQSPPADRAPFDPVAARIGYLHERLRITSAQEPLWRDLAQVLRDNARTLPPLLRERYHQSQVGSAADYLAAFEKLGQAQLDGLKKFRAGFNALYATMSDQQRRIADVILRLSPLAVLSSIFELPDSFTSPPRDTYYGTALAGLSPPITTPSAPFSSSFRAQYPPPADPGGLFQGAPLQPLGSGLAQTNRYGRYQGFGGPQAPPGALHR